ncbi:MAG: hypothetical protein JNM67_00490 [Bacteroidetes bacterium]|nr:hypothetical protein [Bacteroidota bacterium]
MYIIERAPESKALILSKQQKGLDIFMQYLINLSLTLIWKASAISCPAESIKQQSSPARYSNSLHTQEKY